MASLLMKRSEHHSRSQAEQDGALGRRVDPNNLSRAECKVLIEAICRRGEISGKNILSEMWERMDRRVTLLLQTADAMSALRRHLVIQCPPEQVTVLQLQGRTAATHGRGQI